MLLEARNSLDISSGALESREFGIKVDAEMTYTLISGIAKDKSGYMIREMSSNAGDYSPSDKPFEIELPTRFNPNIRWRDYGPSMDHEFVMNRATTIGDSGSRDFSQSSRAAIEAGLVKDKLGGFGLGSKSPFGYLIASSTDGGGSFTVRCFQNGKVRTYLMAISHNGQPECRYFGEVSTNDPDGTEVTVAVRQEDIPMITRQAHQILWTFEPRPKITPTPDDWPSVDEATVESGTNWRLLRSETPLGNRPWVRMGSVAYPIEFDQLISTGDHSWPWKSSAILFDVPIGSLKPIRSREALEYTDTTKAKLHELLVSFEAELAANINKTLSTQPNYLAACVEAHRMVCRTNGLNRLITKSLITFDNKPVITHLEGDRHAFGIMPVDDLDNYSGYEPRWIDTGRWGQGRQTKWQTSIDNLAGIKAVCLHAANFIPDRAREAKVETPFLLVKGGEKAADFAAQFGLPVVDLSKVKLPKRTAGSRPLMTLRKLDYISGSGFASDYVDPDKGGVYVTKVYRGHRRQTTKVRFGDYMVPISHVNAIRNHAINAKIFDVDFKIYAFEHDGKFKPIAENGWVSFDEILKTKIVPKIDQAEYQRIKSATGELNYHHTKLLRIKKAFADDKIPPDILQFLNELKDLNGTSATKRTSEQEDLCNFVSSINAIAPLIQGATKTLSAVCTEKVNALHAKYPLFQMICGEMSFYNTVLEDRIGERLTEYFNLILNQKG